jgi:uncharacterized membrane protein
MSPRLASRLVASFSACGLAVSTYLTIAHYTSPTVLACETGGLVNCERVTTSPQSTFLGIPVAVLGMVWFGAMLLMSMIGAWDRATLHRTRIAWSVVGVSFMLWLVFAELTIVGAICLWCSIAHVFAFLVFLVVMVEASHPQTTNETFVVNDQGRSVGENDRRGEMF